MRVDRQAGVIRGVKILGLAIAQRPHLFARSPGPGRPALRRRQGQRESSQGQPRRPARLPGPHRRDPQRGGAAGDGLFADFHFNPKHALAEQLLWDAEHAPENVGFSHNVEARTAPPRRPAWSSRRSRGCRASIWWPIRPRRAACSSRRPAEAFRRRLPGQRSLDDLQRDHPELVEALCQEQAAEVRRLQAEVAAARARRSRRIGSARRRVAIASRASICRTPSRPIRRRRSSPARDSSNRCWRPRRAGDAGVGRRAGQAGPHAQRRRAGPHRGQGRPLSRDQHLVADAAAAGRKGIRRSDHL